MYSNEEDEEGREPRKRRGKAAFKLGAAVMISVYTLFAGTAPDY